MTCNLVNSVVGPLNTTILVDSQYGRSLTARNLYYVTPNEQIYTYEAYASKKNTIYIKTDNYVKFNWGCGSSDRRFSIRKSMVSNRSC